MKTVLFKLWKFPAVSETFIMAQIVTALKCGYKVKVLLEDMNENDLNHFDEIVKEYDFKSKIQIIDYSIPKHQLLRYTKSCILVLANFRYLRLLWKLFKIHNFKNVDNLFQLNFFKKIKEVDLIHVQYGTNVRPIDSLKEIGFLKSKLVISFHGHDLFFPINDRIHNDKYYDRAFDQADLLVCNTPYLKEKLLKLKASEKKIKVIPVPVDTAFFVPSVRSNLNKNVFNLITVGRLEVIKGQIFGIECVKRLISKGHNVHYTIVGDGGERKFLENVVKESVLENHITFRGSKNQREIRDILQAQDLFLMTSITDINDRAETQGLVTAEAQACGLPVIAFDSGGIKFTLINNQTGYLINEGDIDSMVEKIICLKSNKTLRLQMGKNAVQFVKDNFSSLKVQAVWCEEYKQLIEVDDT